jgi:hypothetical protein
LKAKGKFDVAVRLRKRDRGMRDNPMFTDVRVPESDFGVGGNAEDAVT